jgi:hypothetical protein
MAMAGLALLLIIAGAGFGALWLRKRWKKMSRERKDLLHKLTEKTRRMLSRTRSRRHDDDDVHRHHRDDSDRLHDHQRHSRHSHSSSRYSDSGRSSSGSGWRNSGGRHWGLLRGGGLRGAFRPPPRHSLSIGAIVPPASTLLPPASHHVYLSFRAHASSISAEGDVSSDGALARELCRLLQSKGVSVWWDHAAADAEAEAFAAAAAAASPPMSGESRPPAKARAFWRASDARASRGARAAEAAEATAPVGDDKAATCTSS